MDLFAIIFLEHAANDLPATQCENDRVKSLCNLAVWVDERFQQILSIVLPRDASEFWADLTSLTVDAVTTQARHFGLIIENLAAFLWISAGKCLAILFDQ